MINFHKGEVSFSHRFSGRSVSKIYLEKIKKISNDIIDDYIKETRLGFNFDSTVFIDNKKHYSREIKDLYFHFFVDDISDHEIIKKHEYAFNIKSFVTIVSKRNLSDIICNRKPFVRCCIDNVKLNNRMKLSNYCDVDFLYNDYSLTAKAFLKDPKNALKAEKLKNLVKEKHQHYLNTGSVFSGDTDDYDNYIYVDFLHHDNVKCEAKYEYFQEFDLPNDNIVRPTKFVIEFKYECWFNKDTEKKYYQTFKDEINFY